MFRRPARAALAAALALALAGAPTAGGSTASQATVARIVDGDTLVLAGGAWVRLLQIDAPEAGGECYATAAAWELARLAPPGARVGLEADPELDRVDRYGRLLRYLHAGGRNVNVELVRRGAATPWFYRAERGRYAARLLEAVAAARRERRGLWGACRVRWSPYGPVETARR
jgi:micrococcal nuclease